MIKSRILLVRQYRLPARASLWELPAGRVDKGETVLQAAKRELREETGFKAKKWTKLASFFVSPGFLAEKMTIFVASDLTEGEKEPMEDERIELQWFRAKELDEMIAAGQNTGRQNDDRVSYVEAISRGQKMSIHPNAGKPAESFAIDEHPEADHGLLRRPPGSRGTNAACRIRHIGPSRNIVREWIQ